MIAGHRKDVATMSYLCLRKSFEAERHSLREIHRDRAVGLRGTENATYITSRY